MEGQNLEDAADLSGKMLYGCRSCVEMSGGGDLPEAEADGGELEGSALEQGRGGFEEEAAYFRRCSHVCSGLPFLPKGEMELFRPFSGIVS